MIWCIITIIAIFVVAWLTADLFDELTKDKKI